MIKGRKKRGVEKEKSFSLHVLLEQKNEGVRAHCIEFDLAVCGANNEQAMVRMEKIISAHMNYAIQNKSNPCHMASAEVQQKWFDQNPSQFRKSWILRLNFSKPQSSKAFKPKILRMAQDFGQLTCA